MGGAPRVATTMPQGAGSGGASPTVAASPQARPAAGTMVPEGGAKPQWPGSAPAGANRTAATVVGGKGAQPAIDLSSPKNLTLAQGQELAANYQQLPAAQRMAIEQHPLVAQHGMQPHVAQQLLQWSAPKGTPRAERLQGALQRYMPAHAPTMASAAM